MGKGAKPWCEKHRCIKNKWVKREERFVCPQCLKEYNKQYYQQHRSEYAAYWRQYRQQHRSEYAAYSRQYYQQHRSERAAYWRQYQQQHRSEHAARSRQYQQQYRSERAAYSRQYYQQHRAERLQAARANKILPPRVVKLFQLINAVSTLTKTKENTTNENTNISRED
jgi:hypothetical protein